MKKFILVIALLATSISFAGVKPSLRNEIVEKVNIDLSEIELDEFHQDFVVVSFHIKDSQIFITEIQGSQEQLIKSIQKELSEMDIQKEYSESDVFNYKFTFKKA
ncbi:MAG: hypothetical protein ACI9DK_002298 [Vicingaceae bacterium]|jgi:hypothetical protein